MKISLKGISKAFLSNEIFNGAEFEASSGKITGILGESGTGKSTLINIIGLMDDEYDGKYYIDEECINDLSESKKNRLRGRKIGFIFQNYNLITYYSVKENILLPFRYLNVKPDITNYRSIIEELGLVNLENAYSNNLSGGEKQRVGIARALIMNPSVIIADEPTGNLDVRNKEKVFDILKGIAAKDKIVILVTHDMELAKKCDVTYEIRNKVLVKNETT